MRCQHIKKHQMEPIDSVSVRVPARGVSRVLTGASHWRSVARLPVSRLAGQCGALHPAASERLLRGLLGQAHRSSIPASAWPISREVAGASLRRRSPAGRKPGAWEPDGTWNVEESERARMVSAAANASAASQGKTATGSARIGAWAGSHHRKGSILLIFSWPLHWLTKEHRSESALATPVSTGRSLAEAARRRRFPRRLPTLEAELEAVPAADRPGLPCWELELGQGPDTLQASEQA